MRRTVCAFSILALLVGTGAAFGQAQKGSITVTVEDESGARLPGATVSAESDQTLTRRTAVTDEAGVATLVALDPAPNYVVTTTLDGFNGARNESVRVQAGRDFPIFLTLSLATVKEELVVTAEAPIVDVTSAVTGQDITLQLTESLPTARSYQDYLQLVPGVMPAVEQAGRGLNPASRSGLNYRDLLGEIGETRDNFYYLEGINVTDGVQGLTQTDVNTEIIQEQSVLTGGLPAEFIGANGLVSNVITKSGGNQFTGSVNYYFQNDSLVESNKHFEDAKFDTYDAAVTLGGPIMRDKAWFFASLRNVNRTDTVVDAQGSALRDVESDANQAFVKLSWAPTGKDLITGVYLTDPTDISGQADPNLQNTRDFALERGGERALLSYSRVFSSATLELGFTDHNGDLNRVTAIDAPLNDISFRQGDPFTPQVDEQLGGFGDNVTEIRGTQNIRGSLEYYTGSSWGEHSVKFGVDFAKYDDFRDSNYVTGANEYVSLNSRYLADNITNSEVFGAPFTTTNFNASNPSDYDGFLVTVGTLSAADQAAIFAAYDVGCASVADIDTHGCTPGDGFLDPSEIGDNMVYNSTLGNPDGMINYGRREQLTSGAATTFSEGTTYYVQDTWQWKRWSVNAGVRAEEWQHFASTGEKVFTFDTEYAPRLSVAYDLKGDGRQRLSFYYGRYYDPIRNNATNFVGSLTTRVVEEQVWVDPIQDWVSFRTRGGVGQLDATFSPNTKTPYTDDIEIGYKADLGNSMSAEINLIKRETKDIIEDFDLGLYTDGYPGPINDPDTLYLGEAFFGFAEPPTSNFNIMTLPPGNFRDWKGLELVFRKRYSDNWQMIASYNYADAEGNSMSDSNFDFAGDVLWLDPRAPNIEGTSPGLIEHLFKVAGSYHFDNGLQVGGAYRWNSGGIVNHTYRAFRRHLPVQTCTPTASNDCSGQEVSFPFAGFTPGIGNEWVASDSIGTNEMPSYGVLDARLSYLWKFGNRFQADFFLDIFNVLDEQEAVQIEDRVGLTTTGEGLKFVPPRRYYLGARLRF